MDVRVPPRPDVMRCGTPRWSGAMRPAKRWRTSARGSGSPASGFGRSCRRRALPCRWTTSARCRIARPHHGHRTATALRTNTDSSASVIRSAPGRRAASSMERGRAIERGAVVAIAAASTTLSACASTNTECIQRCAGTRREDRSPAADLRPTPGSPVASRRCGQPLTEPRTSRDPRGGVAGAGTLADRLQPAGATPTRADPSHAGRRSRAACRPPGSSSAVARRTRLHV